MSCSVTHQSPTKTKKTKLRKNVSPKKNTTHNTWHTTHDTREKERLTCPSLNLMCFESVAETQIPVSHSTLEMKPSAVHVLHSWQQTGLHKMVFENFQQHSCDLLFPKHDWPIPKYLWNLAKLVLELFLLLDLPTHSTSHRHSWAQKLLSCSGTSCVSVVWEQSSIVSGDGDWGEKIFVVVFSLFCWQSVFDTIGPVIGVIKSEVLFLVRDSIFGPILFDMLSFKVAYFIWHSCQELSTSDEEEQVILFW